MSWILKRGALALAAALVMASGGYWAAAKFRSPSTSPPTPRGEIKLIDYLDPDYLEAESSSGAEESGLIRFLPDDARMTGVGVATVFPKSEKWNRPELGQWRDLTGVQDAKGLDARPWLKKHRPQGTHYLNFGVWVERDGSAELRTGWVRFEADRLVSESIVVRVPRREAVDFRVMTESGQPVPGALIAVDRHATFEVGLISYLGHTGEDGRLTISGLESRRNWIARLPDGAGPFRRPEGMPFATPAARPVEMIIKSMTGDWTFVKHYLRFTLPGEAIRIGVADAPDNNLPRAWLVNAWVGPGRGPWSPFYVAFRKRPAEGEAISMTLRSPKGGTITLRDVKESSKLTLRTDPEPKSLESGKRESAPGKPADRPR